MLYFLLSILLVVIDQITKVAVRQNLALGGTAPFLPHVLELTYVQNTGAAFSFLAGADLTWLLAIISLVATVVIALVLWRDVFPGVWGRLALALLLAGAAGNLIDRAILGYVTDMFQTVFMDFPVFNVADICVVCGGALMVVYVLFFYDRDAAPGVGDGPTPEDPTPDDGSAPDDSDDPDDGPTPEDPAPDDGPAPEDDHDPA